MNDNDSKNHPMEVYSGESDFEIITNSDSETELSGDYIKLTEKKTFLLAKKNFSNEISGTNEREMGDNVFKKSCENLKVSISQEQISILRNQDSSGADEITGAIKKSQSSVLSNGVTYSECKDRTPHFVVVPIDITQPNESVISKPKLPAIVLTSFDTGNLIAKNQLEARTTDPTARRYRLGQEQVHGNRKYGAEISSEAAGDSDGEENADTLTPLNWRNAIHATTDNVEVKFSNSSSKFSHNESEGSRKLMNQNDVHLQCKLCNQDIQDPRTLNCLHSFCFQCILSDSFGEDADWIRNDGDQYEWNSSLHSHSLPKSGSSDDSPIYFDSHRISCPDSHSSNSSSEMSKKMIEKRSSTEKKVAALPELRGTATPKEDKRKSIICCICHAYTELPDGDVRLLPQNFMLRRRVENKAFMEENDSISSIWCSLCCDQTIASYHCLNCILNLCGFCQDAHQRQRTTANHELRNLVELRSLKASKILMEPKKALKCLYHPSHDLKIFCLSCKQVICSECCIFYHKGHKNEPAQKCLKAHVKQLIDQIERTKPLCDFALHTISKMSGHAKKVNQKCDFVQNDVETFISAYVKAVEVHRQTLLQQIARARENKMQTIFEFQRVLENRSLHAKEAIKFTEELIRDGNDTEILSFVNIVLKRFDFCHKTQTSAEPKIIDTLKFLPEVIAPATKAQNNIPMYGIITTQTVDPNLCTMITEGYAQLRVHKKTELTILTRDAEGVLMCHGGLVLNVILKYKDASSRIIPVEISDKRDGTYIISFVPDTSGVLALSVLINNKHIKESPFMMAARTVRPHTGIYHCCTFCSSKGSKTQTCACGGTMNGFKGCGHGHFGHPGRRHWSCCGNLLENSECSAANSF